MSLLRWRSWRAGDFPKLAIDSSPDAVLSVREDGTIDGVNPAAVAIFGRRASEMVGRAIQDLVSLPGEGTLPGSPGGPWEVRGRARGRTVPMELTLRAVRIEGEPCRIAFLHDITGPEARRRALEHEAAHDALTRLPNRACLARRMHEALARAWEDGGTAAFLLLDLDRFREVNDTLGHATGDLLLGQVAERLGAASRPGSTLARIGGDEFGLLLPDANHEGGREAAWTLVECLRDPFPVEGLLLRVDAAVGIAVFPDHGRDAASLVRRADAAMYAAKRGRIKVQAYDPEHDRHSQVHLALVAELRGALEGGGLALHYQPKVSAARGNVVGVEGLVRWRHPLHGDIAPDEFIAAAEHSGLTVPLTRWVLETALRDGAEWLRQGIDLAVSINVSARNVLDAEFPEILRELLSSAGLPPGRLGLEITEDVIMEDPRRVLDLVAEVARFGVRIAIDDFGTGSSSLGFLKNLPASELKIDGSFVTEMDRDPKAAAVVRATIDLAHDLGLEAVAEGVERAEVWAALRKLGCDFGQGFLFGEAVSAGELVHRLAAPGQSPEPPPPQGVPLRTERR